MDVSIIIVNYNTHTLTSNCIDSIVKNTKDVEYEIILVDNASTDGSKELFEDDSRIKYIYSNKNLGFGRANNLGFKYASGKYVLLLNSDTLLLNNGVYLFWKQAEELKEDVACFGTQLLDKNCKPTHSYGEFPSIISTFKTLLYLAKRKFPEIIVFSNYPQNVDYITGADLFIRKDVIDKLGFFSSDFFMYYEETEMQFRYAKAGYTSLIISGPEIIHLEGASVSEGGNKRKGSKRIMFFTGMYLFMKKRYGLFKYLIFRMEGLLFIPFVVRRENTITENIKLIKLFVLGV